MVKQLTEPRRHIIEIYASTAKVSLMSLFTSELIGVIFVVHFTPIMCYTSSAVSGQLLSFFTVLPDEYDQLTSCT